MATVSRETLVVALSKFVGKSCSGYVAGGAAGSLVTLEFEPRVLRQSPLKNRHLSDLQRRTEAQFAIFVKCVWRLDSTHEVICGAWDDNSPDGPMLQGLKQLVGKSLRSFSLTDPGLDLCLDFDGLCFRVFCDQVNEIDQDDNYILFLPEEILTVATRSKVEWGGGE